MSSHVSVINVFCHSLVADGEALLSGQFIGSVIYLLHMKLVAKTVTVLLKADKDVLNILTRYLTWKMEKKWCSLSTAVIFWEQLWKINVQVKNILFFLLAFFFLAITTKIKLFFVLFLKMFTYVCYISIGPHINLGSPVVISSCW